MTTAVQRPARLAPILTLATLVVIAIVPWGLPSEARFVMPLLPFAAIHYWTVDQRGTMPSVLVFAAGLLIDFVTHGPLGFWSLVFLLGHIAAIALSGPLADHPVKRWLGFVFVVALLSVVQWAIASAYFVRWADWSPFATSAIVLVAFYPMFAWVLRSGRGEPVRSGGGELARRASPAVSIQ